MPPLERQVLDALPFTVYTVDLDGRITYTNRSWARFAQSNGAPQPGDEDAVIGVPIWDAIADVATRDQIEQAMATLREGRAPSVAWEFPRSSPAEERIFLMQVSAIGEETRRHGIRLLDGGHHAEPSLARGAHRHRAWRSRTRSASTGCFTKSRSSSDARMACDTRRHRARRRRDGACACRARGGLRRVAPEAIAARFATTWDEALRLAGTSSRVHSAEGVEITAPMTSEEGVLGAITLTCSPTPARRIEESRRVLETIAAQTAAAVERGLLVERLAAQAPARGDR